MAELRNSTRRINKATLVSIQLPQPGEREVGGALVKLAYVSALALRPGETASVVRSGVLDQEHAGQLAELLTRFEGDRPPSELPPPTVLANVRASQLFAFGRALIAHREQGLAEADEDAAAPTGAPRRDARGSVADSTVLVNTARVALRTFEANVKVSPIGMLNLERIEMRPAGIERGALIATIPLAPQERTSVVHKEWSVTSKEFTSIVTDALEEYSETGVTDNTELTQGVTSQAQHSKQFNVNGSVSGSYPFVSTTTSVGFTAQDQSSESANESRKHAVSVTRKASSRAKQEHKVTISTRTETGTSETSTRELVNSSATDAIRIDYFSMMRKWRVGLFRYGLRMTYDLVIPEPGAAMRKLVAELEWLRAQADVGFAFPVRPSDITIDVRPNENGMRHYLWLADQYKTKVPLYPEPADSIRPTVNIEGGGWQFREFSFDAPPGNAIERMFLDAQVGDVAGPWIQFDLIGSNARFSQGGALVVRGHEVLTLGQGPGGIPFLVNGTGRQHATVFTDHTAGPSWAGLLVFFKVTQERIEQWRADVWNALFNAAQNAYFSQQHLIAQRIREIEDLLASVDTLTLRREENEEIMKGVLRWLLGPTFDFMPPDVRQLFIDAQKGQGGDLAHGINFTGSELGLTLNGWRTMFLYQEMVKFINQAIEWENLLFFVYPYFWDIPASWDFVRTIRHPDLTRQAFLRAGSARVVLTVRKGWEESWMKFVETGEFGSTMLPDDHPYLTIGREIQAYDNTNYPGIPAANPDGGSMLDGRDVVATTSRDSLVISSTPIIVSVASSDGFSVGEVAIVDTWPSGVQEISMIVAVEDDTHITLASLKNPHSGENAPFPIQQAGESGHLIAEWFEYTPTSGTDIEISTKLVDMA